jgi:DNA-binding NtrC family response regulator
MESSLLSIKQRFGIIGTSPLLDRALSTAVRVANTDLTVLISGESGVGKEIFSKIIHSLSPRKHNNFIAINCGAIPEGTINSELFGHEKGAFTGATNERKGYFETYDGGTIFLDEIGEMPLDTQAYLLRVLETGEFIRVGSSKTQKTDVRIIAATNVNLEENIKKNKFRDDLYYRLNTVPIRVPSLKERKEDIFFLFRKFSVDFAEKYKIEPIQIDQGGKEILENYSWPGNIRELKNFAEQASILSEKRMLTSQDLIQLFPNLTQRNLPASSTFENTKDFTGGFQEREILYKLLFDMKKDLNDLKSLIFEVIQSNDLEVNNQTSLNVFSNPEFEFKPKDIDNEPNKPIILDNDFDSMEFIEESLSIEDNEKNLIKKALKKHENRRKDAADELGISERTLYRKIKQYDL